MKLVALADTHGSQEQVELPDGDMLIHCGDFTEWGAGWPDFVSWFERQPHERKVLLPGNHERGSLSDRAIDYLRKTSGFSFLEKQLGKNEVKVGGIKFALPGTAGADVVVAHVPPAGILGGRGVASEGVKRAVEKQQPDLFFCGHVHETGGRVYETAKTKYVNASVYNGEDPFVEIITGNSAKRKRNIKS